MGLAGWRLGFIGIRSISGLLFEVLVVPPLLLLAPHPFGLLGLLRIHLVATNLRVVARLIQFLSRFLASSLLHLALQEATQPILFLFGPYDLLFLLLGDPLLEALNLSPLKLVPLRLPFSIAHPRLILIDVLQFILIFHEVIIVLLIDRILLGFDLIANHHLLIVLFPLSLLFLPLSLPHLLALGEHLRRGPLLFLHLLLPPRLVLLHASAVVLMHLPLLLHVSPPFVLAPSPSLLAELQILIPKILLETVLVIALLVDFFLQKVLRPHNFFKFTALGVERLLPSFEFVE